MFCPLLMLLATARVIQSDQVDFTAANNNTTWKHKEGEVSTVTKFVGLVITILVCHTL